MTSNVETDPNVKKVLDQFPNADRQIVEELLKEKGDVGEVLRLFTIGHESTRWNKTPKPRTHEKPPRKLPHEPKGPRSSPPPPSSAGSKPPKKRTQPKKQKEPEIQPQPQTEILVKKTVHPGWANLRDQLSQNKAKTDEEVVANKPKTETNADVEGSIKKTKSFDKNISKSEPIEETKPEATVQSKIETPPPVQVEKPVEAPKSAPVVREIQVSSEKPAQKSAPQLLLPSNISSISPNYNNFGSFDPNYKKPEAVLKVTMSTSPDPSTSQSISSSVPQTILFQPHDKQPSPPSTPSSHHNPTQPSPAVSQPAPVNQPFQPQSVHQSQPQISNVQPVQIPHPVGASHVNIAQPTAQVPNQQSTIPNEHFAQGQRFVGGEHQQPQQQPIFVGEYPQGQPTFFYFIPASGYPQGSVPAQGTFQLQGVPQGAFPVQSLPPGSFSVPGLPAGTVPVATIPPNAVPLPPNAVPIALSPNGVPVQQVSHPGFQPHGSHL